MTKRGNREAEVKQRWAAIPDPTANNLTAALLDQKVAGAMVGQDYAYAPVCMDHGFGVGIAVANEDGYIPIYGSGISFKHYDEASVFCDGMNKHIGLPMDHAIGIITSTMGGYSYRPRASGRDHELG